jgi:hypothetical protein
MFIETKPELKKVSFTNLLRDKANIGLKDAKLIMDRIIEGEVVELNLFDHSIANEIISEANKFGFNAKIK